MNVKHDKEDILKVGMDLFRTNGYNKTGTNEILKAAGISRGSFYNFFKDKEDFGLAALKHYTENAVRYMEEVLQDESNTPLTRIKLMFEDFVNTYIAKNYQWGCLLAGSSLEMGRVNEAFEAVTKAEFDRYIVALEKCIAEGQATGEIRTDHTARQLAIYTLSTYNGALVMMKAGMENEPLHNFMALGMAYLKV